MSLKRSQESQGGDERYGGQSTQQPEMADRPSQATAAQMARRKIAQTRKASGSARSSRANTPTAPNPYQQQSMGSFLPQGQSGGADAGTGFNFSMGTTSTNPFAQPNGTPPPTNPFGQQNGASSFGGNSFGGSFGGNNNATQTPQQNGLNPSSNASIFAGLSNTNTNTNSAPIFGGFGQSTQTTQPQQNGITPTTATTASFPSFGNQNNGNASTGFQFSQQTPQQKQSTPGTSFGGFGSQQPNGEKAPVTPSFGSFGSQKPGEKPSLFASTSETPKPSASLFSTETPKPSTSLFSGLGQPNGASKPEETPKASSTSLFSNLQQNSSTKGLFGASTSLSEQRPTSPGGSVLTGLDSARASTVTPGMFTQNKASETPKSSLFNFGQPAGDASSEETPKASSNLFSAPKTNGATSNLFSGASNTEQQTPAKQTSNLFSGSFGHPPQQSSSTPGFNFGQIAQSQQDTSMTTPGNTPQKPSTNVFQQSQSRPAANEQSAPPSETPAGQGKSLFDRISPRDEPPATTQKPSFTPSTSMFSAANNKENETPSSGSLFQQPSCDEQPSKSQPNTGFTPSTSLFSKPASQASQTPSAAPWLSHAAAAPTPPTTKVTPATPQPPTTATRAATASVSMSEQISEAEKGTFKLLNEGLMKHLTTQNPNVDWTTIMQYYLQQAAKIRNKPEPKFDAPTIAQTTARPPSSSGLGEKSISTQQSAGLSQPAKPVTPSTTSNMFSSSLTPKPTSSTASNLFTGVQTPKPSAFNSQPSKPPATAPVNRKRPGPFTEDNDDEDAERGPATEKRARRDEPINYPKLPAGASETSRLFQAALDKPADKATSGPDQNGASASSAAGSKSSGSGSTSGFNVTSFNANSTSTGFKPQNAGPPTVSPTTLKRGFLASFGKQASKAQEKEKKDRRDDDFDSDEETQDEWDKRYEEEQAARRQKIKDEGKKVAGFVFNPAAAKMSSDAVSVFSHMSQTTSEASDYDTEDDKADAEKAQGSGDNTWKPKTPIKFGSSMTGNESTTPAAAPPTFGNLFGSTPATGGSSSLLSVPGAKKPSMGFNFTPNTGSSAATSRATTPGVTTDGEGSTAGDGDDDEPHSNEPQVEDQTGLRPEEMANEELIFSCPLVTAKKIKTIKDPEATGGEKRGWDTIAIGPLYVLKNTDTGKTRVLLKVPPFGNAKMNFPPVARMNYDLKGKNKQMVQGAFVDHINESPPKLAPYLIDAGADYGERLAKVLNENRPAPPEPAKTE